MRTDHRGRLHHRTPAWVPEAAIFHIRVRSRPPCAPLTDPLISKSLLQSVRVYTDAQRWSCYLFLIMPDHVHGLFGFPQIPGMSRTVASWKAFHARHTGIRWQANFFDHRIRSGAEFSEKHAYILRNPVAKELCHSPGEWPHRISAFTPDSLPRF